MAGMTESERLQELLGLLLTRFCGGTKRRLAEKLGKDESYIGRLFYKDDKRGKKGIGKEIMDASREAFPLPIGFWEMSPDAAKAALDGVPHVVTPEHEGAPLSMPINLHYAKGSCGGGHLNDSEASMIRQQLVKEESWFRRYSVKPEDVFAMYADGDSMAEFIVDGDIVFFNKKITRLTGGVIYAIDTHDGTKIKRVHIRADGSIVLSSDNQNKAKYPDELYSREDADILIVRGQFFYRQG